MSGLVGAEDCPNENTPGNEGISLLKMRAEELKETNIALKVLLKQRENDKSELEEKILANIKSKTRFLYRHLSLCHH